MFHFSLRGHALFALFALSALAPGCGSERPQAGDTRPPASGPGQGTPFENPGGMWLPEQMAQHKDQLKALGLEIAPESLTDPTASPLGAVVSLGGCSASFVSADGLIATNHHCSTRALQYNSTPEQDLLTNGYLARTRAEEKWAGPTARVFVTRAFRDVTGEVRRGIASISSDLARYEEIEKRKKQLVAACEEGRPEVRCSIAEYFGGGKISLIEQLEIKDVRIVYVPHEGIGNFGGELDNWRWPRHSGDFAFFRAYVGKDNRPANHADDNVPYRPAHHLKLASAPLNQDDLVMVAGYPGTTNRLRTAAEVESAVSWQYPKRVSFYEESIALLEDLGKRDPAARIKAQPTIQGYSNYLLKTRGLLDGLVEGGLAREKAKLEEELKAWIDADPARKAAYGGAIEQIAAAHAEQQKTREHDATVSEILSSARLLDAAVTIVRMAEERPKADAERDAEYQKRNWERLEQAQVSLQKSYSRTIDQGTFKLAVKRALRLDAKERPALIGSLAGGQAPTEATLGAAIDAIYAGTALEDATARVKLLKTATVDELKESRDPMIRLALELAPVDKAIEARDKAYAGAMTLVKPRFVEALREYRGGMLAPDANGTLRITYGTVRGYKPEIDKPVYRPFTVVSELVKKNTGKPPFNAPEALLEAAREKRFGPYVDDDLGEVPVCFLSDLDITNGNSGSATLNARGELVGLAFDGNYEAMASDWLFMPSITRTIHVDHRYMQWVMDAVSGADAVLQEMGGTPVLP
ncbi:S46 family peptidase [Sorangium sp. So ce119]|uniref:S46 family peptidase n=1 Tax=Sorangium sp. So ce119 TaxID=3133279 RepID=UPI003F61B5CC